MSAQSFYNFGVLVKAHIAISTSMKKVNQFMEKNIKGANTDYLYSPSDLVVFVRSRFSAWMDRFKIERPEEANKIKLDDDPMMSLLSYKGGVHEYNYLNLLKTQYGEDQVVLIDSKIKDQAEIDTMEAMKKGCQVIFQAYLRRGNFVGFIDFLIRRDGESDLGGYYYEACDTKLTKSARPYFFIQLCAYSWMLEQAQGRLPDEFKLVFGNQEVTTYRLQKYYAYFNYLKEDFLAFQESFSTDTKQRPDPALFTEYGRWQTHAQNILNESNSLALIANIRKNQIKKLNKGGINTLNELAATELTCASGIGQAAFNKLKAQAQIQKASGMKAQPLFSVIQPDNGKGLSALPPPSLLDVYFDIEGHPLVEGGLEYLWGISFTDPQGPNGKLYAYRDWWAHTEQQEKHAFEQFIDWVFQRWEQDKRMHIYHYASYEVTAIRKISNRYNTRTEKVDQLLRQHVLVDLYKIVKNGLLVGEPSYSLKNIEHLYREKRETEVASGGESIVFYENWRESGGVEKWCEDENGYKAWLSAEKFDWDNWPELKQIREYNIDDCESTLDLVKWLRVQAKDHNIEFSNIQSETEEPEQTDQQVKFSQDKKALQDRQRTLLDKFEGTASLQSDPKAQLLSDLVEYFVREGKAKAWEYYDRLEKSHVELFEDDNVIVDVKILAQHEEDGKIILQCSFDETQPIRIDKFKSGRILDSELKIKSITFDKGDAGGVLNLQIKQEDIGHVPTEPFSILGQNDFISTAKLESKICGVAEEYFNRGSIQSALDTALDRLMPSFIDPSAAYLPITRARYPDNDDYLNAIVNAIKNMNDTCLCIQGPPGSGKTHTAAYVIEALLKSGKRVGILSNGHEVIMNLMKPLLTTKSNAKIVKVGGHYKNQMEFLEQYPKEKFPNLTYRPSFSFTKTQPYEYFDLVGATAYALCDDVAWKRPLDYLFIDEASQVSLAHLVAVSGSARNIILMGDQMQLEQPTQGAHPGDAALSSLKYILGAHAVILEDLGIFLERTYRMHPAVCDPLSKVVYEGKLFSDAAMVNQSIHMPKQNLITIENGILWLPVKHEGNTQSSQEEVEHIQRIISELLTGSFTDKEKNTRSMTEEDILVVAPYNMQVNLLKENLSKNIKIGTIDKFQGQQAPAVIISMGVSVVNDSARGLDFVFDINRLNVAVSRAQSLAIIVSNDDLYKCHVSSISQLEKASFYCSLIKYHG
jgi:uncharacterized protein